MKEIKAYIKPHKLGAVIRALHGIGGLTGASTVRAQGFGRSRGKSERHLNEGQIEREEDETQAHGDDDY